MKQVYVAQTPPEAHLVKGFIESHDIKAMIHGEDLFGVRGGLPWTAETSPSVWVAEADFERAQDLVEAFFRGGDGDAGGENWRCHVCGEILEAQFTECWNCGASRYLTTDTPTE